MGEQSTLIPHGDSGTKSVVTIQMNVEKLRFFALSSFILMAFVCDAFSSTYVFYPEGHSAENPGPAPFLSSIFGMPWVDSKQTHIFKIFGFLHLCSTIDFMPAKEIFAVFLPLFNIPMIAYLILKYYSLKVQVMDGVCDKSVLAVSKFTTPLCIGIIAVDHLWFVNDPELTWYQGGWDPSSGQAPKGLGFVGHYLPYLLFQTAMAVIAAMQVQHLVGVNKIPFNVPIGVARGYVYLVWTLTLVYQVFVCTLLAGRPILDPTGGAPWENFVFYFLTQAYDVVCLYFVLVLSFVEMRYGETNTIKIMSP